MKCLIEKKKTVVLRRWCSETLKFGMKQADNGEVTTVKG